MTAGVHATLFVGLASAKISITFLSAEVSRRPKSVVKSPAQWTVNSVGTDGVSVLSLVEGAASSGHHW